MGLFGELFEKKECSICGRTGTACRSVDLLCLRWANKERKVLRILRYTMSAIRFTDSMSCR